MEYAAVVIQRIKQDPKGLIRTIITTNTPEGKRLLEHLKKRECEQFPPNELHLYESIRYNLGPIEFHYRHKKFERNEHIYEECSAQICIKASDRKILIRCDNSDEYIHNPNIFHMDLEIINSRTGRREKRRIYDRLYCKTYKNELINSWLRGRFATYQVLRYFEENFQTEKYLSYVPLYITLPFLTHMGLEFIEEIVKIKPPNVSITDFSFVLMDLFYLTPQDKPENLRESLVKLSQKARDILTGRLTYEIYLRKCSLPFPIPLIAFPKSYLKIDVWTEKPVRLNFVPIGKVIEKQESLGY